MGSSAWIDAARADIAMGTRIGPWQGLVWRCHARHYAADSAEGSRRASGRYHRATDRFPAGTTWLALYTGCTEAIALAEVIRNAGAGILAKLPILSVSCLEVQLSAVYRIYDPAVDAGDSLLGLDFAAECEGTDYTHTHALARMAREAVEAIQVPSCTGLHEGNLIIFPDRLHPSSRITVVSTTELRLTK